jgi:acyl-coenzyme A thioesterase 9
VHRAFSLAEATAYLFAGARPTFLEVDRIEFRKPVDIGDLVRLKSRVLYSSSNVAAAAAAAAGSGADKVVLVEVICQIVRPEKAASLLSNRFHFVFKFPADNDVVLKEVLPTSVEEAHALIRASAWNHHDAFCLL